MVDTETRLEYAFAKPTKLFTPFVTCAIVLMIIGYALFSHAREFTIEQLCLSRSAIFQGKVWQFVTYPFINTGCSLAFNGLVVLFIGSSIEKEWRTKSILTLWLIVSLVCGLAWVLISILFGKNFIGIGTYACGYGLIAAFGILYRKKKFIFWFWPMEAQHIALLFIGIGLVLSIGFLPNFIWVMGALVSYLYVKFLWQRAINSPMKILRNENSRGGGFIDLD